MKLWPRMTNWLCQTKYAWKFLQKVSTSWASFFIRIRKAMKTLLYTCKELFACSVILAPGRSLKLIVAKLRTTSSISKTIKAFNLPFLQQLQKFWLPINGSYFVLFLVGFFRGEVTSHSSGKKIGNPKTDLKIKAKTSCIYSLIYSRWSNKLNETNTKKRCSIHLVGRTIFSIINTLASDIFSQMPQNVAISYELGRAFRIQIQRDEPADNAYLFPEKALPCCWH